MCPETDEALSPEENLENYEMISDEGGRGNKLRTIY